MTTYQELLRRRKDRACAVILSLKEREVDPLLNNSEISDRLRKVVLDQLNDLYTTAHDIISALEGGDVTFNELFLEKIEQIHAAVVQNGH